MATPQGCALQALQPSRACHGLAAARRRPPTRVYGFRVYVFRVFGAPYEPQATGSDSGLAEGSVLGRLGRPKLDWADPCAP